MYLDSQGVSIYAIRCHLTKCDLVNSREYMVFPWSCIVPCDSPETIVYALCSICLV